MSEKVVTEEDVKIVGTWDSKVGGHSAFAPMALKRDGKPMVLPTCVGRDNWNRPIKMPDRFIINGIVKCPVCGGRFKVE